MTGTQFYAGILGLSPSKGARSPTLWNAVFREFNVSAKMVPMDIVPENLKSTVEQLRTDKRFIGGAVTMPYKIDIVSLLDGVENEAKTIGAVNCLYRDGERLVGANTDGTGAIWSLERQYGSIRGKTILLLGTGGAGFAVATYVAMALGPQGQLILANRSLDSKNRIAHKLGGFCRVRTIDSWPIQGKVVGRVDILINSTSIGFENNETKPFSPLGEFSDQNERQTKQALSDLGHPFVFDIIYQPLQTTLLRIAQAEGCGISNGLEMNLEQAVIAFNKATRSRGINVGSHDQIRQVMSEA